MDTGTVRTLGLAAWVDDAPVAPPDEAVLPGNVGWASPWLTLGGQPRVSPEQADIGSLDKDKVVVTPKEENTEFRAPLDQNKTDEIVHKNATNTVAWSCYSTTEDIAALSSGANSDLVTPVDGEIQEGLAIVWYSLAWEVTGLAIYYCPKVRVKVKSEDGGVTTLKKMDFEAEVFGTPEIPSGMQRISLSALVP